MQAAHSSGALFKLVMTTSAKTSCTQRWLQHKPNSSKRYAQAQVCCATERRSKKVCGQSPGAVLSVLAQAKSYDLNAQQSDAKSTTAVGTQSPSMG